MLYRAAHELPKLFSSFCAFISFQERTLPSQRQDRPCSLSLVPTDLCVYLEERGREERREPVLMLPFGWCILSMFSPSCGPTLCRHSSCHHCPMSFPTPAALYSVPTTYSILVVGNAWCFACVLPLLCWACCTFVTCCAFHPYIPAFPNLVERFHHSGFPGRNPIYLR